MVAEGDDLSPQGALMRDFADEVNSTGYEYRPYSQNSNSFAGGALQRAGLMGSGSKIPERFDEQPASDPASGETSLRFVPGFEATLKNPVNTATPSPFPLDVRTGVPAGNNAAPDRRGSLDGGFGSRDVAGSTTPGVGDAGPTRFLGRRTYSLSALDTNPAASDVGDASSQPPNDGGPLTLMEAYLQYRGRLDANRPQGSAIAADPDDSDFSGGLLGRLIALMRQNPDMYGPPPQDS